MTAGAAWRLATAAAVVATAIAGCTTYSFKKRAPFETTAAGFWYRADCGGPCDLTSETAEAERRARLDEAVRRHGACPGGYVIEKREPLAVTRTAPPDIVVYEARCLR